VVEVVGVVVMVAEVLVVVVEVAIIRTVGSVQLTVLTSGINVRLR
jgi:hypothetical protein